MVKVLLVHVTDIGVCTEHEVELLDVEPFIGDAMLEPATNGVAVAEAKGSLVELERNGSGLSHFAAVV